MSNAFELTYLMRTCSVQTYHPLS